MPSVPHAVDDRRGGGSRPRRAALLQKRSRNTRRRLIRAALELWNERGFDDAFEATSAEEIARTAGVSKGTFYFHFAHKEDILLEMSWATAEIAGEEAAVAMGRGDETFELVERLMTSLAGRVSQAPRGAVLRVTGHWSRLIHTNTVPVSAQGFAEVFDSILRYATARGDLSQEVDEAELATLLQAATMDALVGWAATAQSPAGLRQTLCRRADVILSGAAISYGR
jgi:AcrR family transcriptional regulator